MEAAEVKLLSLFRSVHVQMYMYMYIHEKHVYSTLVEKRTEPRNLTLTNQTITHKRHTTYWYLHLHWSRTTVHCTCSIYTSFSLLISQTELSHIQFMYSLFPDGYTGDVYLLVKLLLPTAGKKRVYNLQSKQIVKLLSQVRSHESFSVSFCTALPDKDYCIVVEMLTRIKLIVNQFKGWRSLSDYG